MSSLPTLLASRFFIWERVVFLFIFLIQYGVNAQVGTFANGGKFWLVKANQPSSFTLSQIQLASTGFGNNSIVNVSKFAPYTGPIGLYVPVTCCFSKVNFTMDGVTTTDPTNVFSMGPGGNTGGNYQAVPSLRINGAKNILIQGIIGNNTSTDTVVSIFNLFFTVVGGSSSVIAPTASPSSKPSAKPSSKPSAKPSAMPSAKPSSKPSAKPSAMPSAKPLAPPVTVIAPVTDSPSSKPSTMPSARPLSPPVTVIAPVTDSPSSKPSAMPSARPLALSPPVTVIAPVTDSPSSKPSAKPSSKPIAKPSSKPSSKPSKKPSAKPITVSTPTMPTTGAPIIRLPVPPEQCTIPKFVTPTWESYQPKPGSQLGEAMGGGIGYTELIVFGGFNGTWDYTTNESWVYNTQTNAWRKVDPVPIPEGISHMGNTIVNENVIYGCGGFLGGKVLGLPATSRCVMYTHNNPPGTQWRVLPDIPGIRSGGATLYDTTRNSIFYVGGTSTHKPPGRDWNNVWELSMIEPITNWTSKANAPYAANHLGSTTVVYGGMERHFVLGGQRGSFEATGNFNLMYEYFPMNDTWAQRRNLTVPTGHVSSSTIPWKNCGIFIVGGAINNNTHTSEVYYYSIKDDNWTRVGNLTRKLSTPVCTFRGDWLYCQTGANALVSFRRKVL